MSLSPRQVLTIAVATLGLTVPLGCSQEKENASSKAPTTQPSGSIDPNTPSLPTVPALGEPIPFSINCGNRIPEMANDPEAFSGEHFLITNNADNQVQIENTRLPLDIVYENGSDPAFVDAFETTRSALGAVVIPTDVNGSVIISYPGTQPGETTNYQISVSTDGTITVGPNPGLMGGVALQSFVDAQGHQINMAFFENSKGDSVTSFLEPGKDEWDNIADAPKKPSNSEFIGFTEFDDVEGAYLNIPISRFGETRSGMQIFDPSAQTACVAQTGDAALEPRSMAI